MSQTESTKAGSFDPFELWRQFYEANEQAWTKTIREMTTSQDYAEAQGKLLESMLAFQKTMRDGMSAQLNSLNLPTRDDVSRLGELVLSMEEKIDLLDDRLPALDKRLGALEKKLDGLVDQAKKSQLGDLEKKVDKLAGLEKKVDKLGDIEKKVDKLAGLDKKIDAVDHRIVGLTERVARQVQRGAQADGAAPERASRAAAARSQATEKTE